LACKWAQIQEQTILKNGTPLSPQHIPDAINAGVAYPDKIRILLVTAIPVPDHPLLREACAQTQLISPQTAGLTLGYGIFIRSDCAKNHEIYAHEFVHVMQHESWGGISQFLQRYLFEVITTGYPSAPMEQEAIKKAKDIIKRNPLPAD